MKKQHGNMLFAFILLIFLLGSEKTSQKNDQYCLCEVNGRSISHKDVMEKINHLSKKGEISSQDSKMKKKAKYLEIFNSLLRDVVMQEEAASIGIKHKDNVAQSSIFIHPKFLNKEGEFDKGIFEKYLEENNLTEGAFINKINKEKCGKILQNTMNQNLKLSENFQNAIKQCQRKIIKASYCQYPIKNYSFNNKEEEKEFYNRNAHKAVCEEKRNVYGWRFKIDDIVNPSEEDIKRIINNLKKDNIDKKYIEDNNDNNYQQAYTVWNHTEKYIAANKIIQNIITYIRNNESIDNYKYKEIPKHLVSKNDEKSVDSSFDTGDRKIFINKIFEKNNDQIISFTLSNKKEIIILCIEKVENNINKEIKNIYNKDRNYKEALKKAKECTSKAISLDWISLAAKKIHEIDMHEENYFLYQNIPFMKEKEIKCIEENGKIYLLYIDKIIDEEENEKEMQKNIENQNNLHMQSHIDALVDEIAEKSHTVKINYDNLDSLSENAF